MEHLGEAVGQNRRALLLVLAHTTVAEAQRSLEQINQTLTSAFQIKHTTIQMEYQDLQAGEPE